MSSLAEETALPPATDNTDYQQQQQTPLLEYDGRLLLAAQQNDMKRVRYLVVEEKITYSASIRDAPIRSLIGYSDWQLYQACETALYYTHLDIALFLFGQISNSFFVGQHHHHSSSNVVVSNVVISKSFLKTLIHGLLSQDEKLQSKNISGQQHAKNLLQKGELLFTKVLANLDSPIHKDILQDTLDVFISKLQFRQQQMTSESISDAVNHIMFRTCMKISKLFVQSKAAVCMTPDMVLVLFMAFASCINHNRLHETSTTQKNDVQDILQLVVCPNDRQYVLDSILCFAMENRLGHISAHVLSLKANPNVVVYMYGNDNYRNSGQSTGGSSSREKRKTQWVYIPQKATISSQQQINGGCSNGDEDMEDSSSFSSSSSLPTTTVTSIETQTPPKVHDHPYLFGKTNARFFYETNPLEILINNVSSDNCDMYKLYLRQLFASGVVVTRNHIRLDCALSKDNDDDVSPSFFSRCEKWNCLFEKLYLFQQQQNETSNQYEKNNVCYAIELAIQYEMYSWKRMVVNKHTALIALKQAFARHRMDIIKQMIDKREYHTWYTQWGITNQEVLFEIEYEEVAKIVFEQGPFSAKDLSGEVLQSFAKHNCGAALYRWAVEIKEKSKSSFTDEEWSGAISAALEQPRCWSFLPKLRFLIDHARSKHTCINLGPKLIQFVHGLSPTYPYCNQERTQIVDTMEYLFATYKSSCAFDMMFEDRHGPMRDLLCILMEKYNVGKNKKQTGGEQLFLELLDWTLEKIGNSISHRLYIPVLLKAVQHNQQQLAMRLVKFHMDDDVFLQDLKKQIQQVQELSDGEKHLFFQQLTTKRM